jgi:glycosyltransferase involved in cell wall biosynthesis
MKVVWLTNLPAPYRFPIWDRISETHDLRIVFTHGSSNRRGWSVNSEPCWRYEFLGKKIYYWGESEVILDVTHSKRITLDCEVLVIGGWDNFFYVSSIMIAKLKKIKVIQFYESVKSSHRFENLLVNWIRFKMLNFADFVVTPGVEATSALLAMGIKIEKIVQLFNVVDVDFFSSATIPHIEKPVGGHNFVFVGRLISIKNVTSLIRAFKDCANSLDSLTIAGGGELRSQLEELVNELNLQSQVFFVGHLSPDELLQLFSSSHTLVLPSANEVWGLVVNEALAAGLHTVVSENCGVSSSVSKMKGVYICETSVSSISEMMKKSRAEFSGYIVEPEILRYKPEEFADRLMELFGS